MTFLQKVRGTVPEIHCMIEAKRKDEALFQLANDLKSRPEISMIDQASFRIRG